MSHWQGPRALLEDEWPALRAAVNRAFRPGGSDLAQELPLLFDPENRENLRVFVAPDGDEGGGDGDGRIVAFAGGLVREASVLRRRVRVGFVGAVFTTPEARGQRLGTRVLIDALERVRPGADLVLISGDRDLYRRQGFEPVPPLARFVLPPPAGPLAGLELRTATVDDLDQVAALHDAEDVHFARPRADWLRLLAAGRLVDAPAVFSVATRAGQVVAFVAAQCADRRPDGSTRPRRILEIAGERAAIVAAAPALAEELLVPNYDSTTIALAEKNGWIRTARQFPFTAEALTAAARVIPWYGLNYL